MSLTGWMLVGGDAVVAALLVRSSALKAVTPDVIADALAELSRGRWRPSARAMRAVAGIELTAALAITAPSLRVAAWVITGLLGISFVVLGTAGLLTGSTRPCGCFGAESERPLGVPSVLAGSAFLALAAINIADAGDAGMTGAHVGVAVVAAVIVLTWTLAAHRREAMAMISTGRLAP
ncbi:MAG TPA: MauE/DoxX family redox-associated membrane protein [Streptosporangiaceae bacterium]